MTRSMQFISYQIGGEKSKLGLKQNHGCKRGGKWWTISNRQFMWFSKMFWIGYGISLNRSSRVWLLCMDARQDQALIKTAENCGNTAFWKTKACRDLFKGTNVWLWKGRVKRLTQDCFIAKRLKSFVVNTCGAALRADKRQETNHVPAWNCDSQ